MDSAPLRSMTDRELRHRHGGSAPLQGLFPSSACGTGKRLAPGLPHPATLRLQGSVPLLTLSSSPNLARRVSDGQHSWDLCPSKISPSAARLGPSGPACPPGVGSNSTNGFPVDHLTRLPGFVLRESPLLPPANRLPPAPSLGFSPLQGSTSAPARLRSPGSLLPWAWFPVQRRAPAGTCPSESSPART